MRASTPSPTPTPGRDGGGYDPRECSICRLLETARDDGLVVAEADRWVLRHHLPPAPLAGWLLLCARRHVQGPARLESDEDACEFGLMVRDAARALEVTTGALRVYAIAFGEGSQHLHVHLIPRLAAHPETAAWNVADWYRAVERGERRPASDAAIADACAMVRGELLRTNGGRWRS
ncbi:MAG: diadenosine tetraphosphate hydrolase [Phycisphaerae bacterium]|nr:diadenosine tetraphosphate hydrolase [Phycisphaerae bacterium]